MTRLHPILIPLATTGLLLFGTPPAAAEQLVSPALPGFVVGYEAANAEQSIREQIPAGETVQEWTRMVTTQRFGDAATRLTPTDLLGVIARNLAATCPGSTTSEMVTRPRNGHAAAQFRADCPLLAQTGKPETFIILVVAGAEDLHAKQVAFRRVPTAADLQWAEDVLAAVALCETGQDGDACRVQD